MGELTERIRVGDAQDGVVTIELASPDRRNALDGAMVAALGEALRRAGEAPSTRAVVLLGNEEVFCSGAPRELLEELVDGKVAPADLRLARAVLEVPVPTIAAMEGHAVGGGLALGLAADVVLLSRESRYGCNFMELGFTPGMGTTRLLEHVLSPAMAHELLYTAELRKGAELAGASGVNHILPRAQVRPKALSIAGRIADKPRLSLEVLKRTLSLRRRQAFDESLALEALMHQVTLPQDEVRRRIEERYVE